MANRKSPRAGSVKILCVHRPQLDAVVVGGWKDNRKIVLLVVDKSPHYQFMNREKTPLVATMGNSVLACALDQTG
jgi:hypothetical protein